MLTPARPQPGHPDYQERLRRFREAAADKKRHPHNWGMVRPAAPTSGGSAAPQPDGGKPQRRR